MNDDDLTEYCPCAGIVPAVVQTVPLTAKVMPLAFRSACASYTQATRGCALHGRCWEADKVERREARDLKGCRDFAVLEPAPAAVPVPWAHTPAVREEHIAELRRVVAAKPPPLPNLSGAGVLLVGGGNYWPMIVVSIRMLREVSDLPIQVWHRGRAEPVRYEDVYGIPGVTIRDTTQVQPTPRVLGGWEAKTIALRNCGWERVLYLDADAYVVSDPQPLLDLLDTERFVFWSDLPHQADNVKWEWFGIPPGAVPPVQGGQLAINVRAFWRELCIADWLNQHSDYFYGHQFGDQDSWRVALAATAGTFKHLGAAPWQWPAFVCGYGNNNALIIHRCQGKLWGLSDAKPAMHLPKEAKVFQFLAEREVGTGTAAEVFGRIYADGHWGGPPDTSGAGSSAAEAGEYLAIVNRLIKENGWQSVVDLGSGDGYVCSRLEADQVTGIDVHAASVLRLKQQDPSREWLCLDLDLQRSELPSADVALLKDVLQHWPEALLKSWLSWALQSGKWKALVLCNDHTQIHHDCILGAWRGLNPNMEPLRSIAGLSVVAHYLKKSVCLLRVQL